MPGLGFVQQLHALPRVGDPLVEIDAGPEAQVGDVRGLAVERA